MAFGVTTDYFSIGDTKWEPQSSTKEPSASNAQSHDSYGTIACENIFEEFYTWGVAYKVKSAATDTNGVIALSVDTKAVIGKIFAIDTNTNAVVTGIEGSTSMSETPLVTVTAEEYFGDTQGQPTYVPTLTVLGVKKAQAFGWVADTNTRTISGNFSVTGQVERVLDSIGDPCQTNVYQGRVEGTGDLDACTGTPSAVADTANGWAFSTQVGNTADNTDYAKGAVSAFENLARTAPA